MRKVPYLVAYLTPLLRHSSNPVSVSYDRIYTDKLIPIIIITIVNK